MLPLLIALVSSVAAQDYSCDAGLFIPEQFGGNYNKPPVTIQSKGVLADINAAECDQFPVSGACADALAGWAPGYMTNLSLSDPNEYNPAQPNGEVFCQFLGSQQKGTDKRINGTMLQMHGRINGCCETPCEWNEERVFAVHSEELCCDIESNWVACPLPTGGASDWGMDNTLDMW